MSGSSNLDGFRDGKYSLTDMLLSVDTDISIRRHVFLLKSLTTKSGLFLFIFLSVSIAKSYFQVFVFPHHIL